MTQSDQKEGGLKVYWANIDMMTLHYNQSDSEIATPEDPHLTIQVIEKSAYDEVVQQLKDANRFLKLRDMFLEAADSHADELRDEGALMQLALEEIEMMTSSQTGFPSKEADKAHQTLMELKVMREAYEK